MSNGTDKYILAEDGRTPVVCNDIMTWGQWMQSADRYVGSDKFDSQHVSTVFLGLDHGFGNSDPILFETMIFGGEHDQYQERYATWEEAEAGHKRAVAMCLEA